MKDDSSEKDGDASGMRGWARRELLGALSVAGLPRRAAAASASRNVGIVGGAMAGVSLAWLLDGERDVVLLEARDSLGGNVQSMEVEVDGRPYVVDLGAQYFHPGPYPTYAALLSHLGLFPPGPGGSHAFPVSITLWAPPRLVPDFVSPILPDRFWPALAGWNRAGLQAFTTAFRAAKAWDEAGQGWGVTLEDWLPTLGLTPEQWEGMILPWAVLALLSSRERGASGSRADTRGRSTPRRPPFAPPCRWRPAWARCPAAVEPCTARCRRLASEAD